LLRGAALRISTSSAPRFAAHRLCHRASIARAARDSFIARWRHCAARIIVRQTAQTITRGKRISRAALLPACDSLLWLARQRTLRAAEGRRNRRRMINGERQSGGENENINNEISRHERKKIYQWQWRQWRSGSHGGGGNNGKISVAAAYGMAAAGNGINVNGAWRRNLMAWRRK